MLVTTTAQAPSEICEALPAVIVPSARNAGLRPASFSGVVSGRIPSSRSTLTGAPFAFATSTDTTSSAMRPDPHAVWAR